MGGGGYNGLLREFARLQSLQGLLDVLQVMAHFHLEPSAQALELVANVAVHDVEFVKGAVSMDTLPPEGIPEACFAGRSNVGKSSLVNMMCNRKKLAFTSKTPGKTQEFNYFLVTGGRAAASSMDARGDKNVLRSGPRHKNVFHLVDLPGVGYAEVPNFKREEWKRFYRRYLLERASLRVIFQLIDGRHGALKDDLELADLIQQTRNARAAASPPPQPGASRQQAASEGGGGGGGGDSMRRGETVESLGVVEHVVVVTKMDKRESKSDARLLNDLRYLSLLLPYLSLSSRRQPRASLSPPSPSLSLSTSPISLSLDPLSLSTLSLDPHVCYAQVAEVFLSPAAQLPEISL
jgi:GTP-binding protein EngB required for normal cell division